MLTIGREVAREIIILIQVGKNQIHLQVAENNVMNVKVNSV